MCIANVMGFLSPTDFYLPQNREIYETICSMFNYSEHIDPVTVLHKMKQTGIYQEKTSYHYIYQLVLITPTSAHVMEYAKIVKDKSLLRQIAQLSQDLSTMIQDESAVAQEILQSAEERIHALRQEQSSKGIEHISTILLEMYELLEERASSGAEIPGISTGLPSLDSVISGLNKSDLILLAARPGMGKTSMALNILLSAAKDPNLSIVFFSLEMGRIQLATRLVSGEAFIPNKKLVTGDLSQEDWDRIAAASVALNNTKIYINDNPLLTVADMKAQCRRMDNLGLVIIDYLQLMTSSGGVTRRQDNRQQIVSDISRSLKIMAKELNVPVLCLSQLSRANEARSNRRPVLSDLRESGAIEQDADIVMFLYREGYYDESTEMHNLAECIIAKNRHGETGTVQLQWFPEYTSFRSIDYVHENP